MCFRHLLSSTVIQAASNCQHSKSRLFSCYTVSQEFNDYFDCMHYCTMHYYNFCEYTLEFICLTLHAVETRHVQQCCALLNEPEMLLKIVVKSAAGF